jgi:hypothetical protein
MKFRAAGFNKVRLGELFNLLEGIVELKVNAIMSYAYNVDKTAFETLKKTRKSGNGEMLHRKCGQSEVWREEPLQQNLSDGYYLRPVVNTIRKEQVRT